MADQSQLSAENAPAKPPSVPDRPTLMQRGKWFAALAVTVGIFAVLLIKTDIRGVAEALRGAEPMPMVAAVLVSVVVKVVLGADKWRLILAALSCRLSFGEAFFVRTANAPLRFTPGKLGTLLGAVYLWRHRGLPFAKGVSSLLLERLQNLAVLIAFVILGPMVFHVTSQTFTPLSGAHTQQTQSGALGRALPAQVDYIFSRQALIISAACLVLLAVLYALRRPLYALVARVNVKIANAIKDLSSCLHEIKPAPQAGLLLYAAVGQVGEIVMGFLIFRAVGVPASFGTVFIGLALIVIISNIPITVAGLGTREAAIILLFGAYADTPVLLTVGMLITAIGYIIPVLIGLPLLGSFLQRVAADPSAS